MSYKDIDIVVDKVITFQMMYFAIHNLRKHWHTIKRDTIDSNAAIVQIMHILGQSLQRGINHTSVMIPGNEYFMLIRQIAKPFKKIKRLLIRTIHSKVPAMHQHVGHWHITKTDVFTMSIRYVKNLQENLMFIFLILKIKSIF